VEVLQHAILLFLRALTERRKVEMRGRRVARPVADDALETNADRSKNVRQPIRSLPKKKLADTVVYLLVVYSSHNEEDT